MDQELNAGQQHVQIHLSVRAGGPPARAAAKPSSATPSAKHAGWREILAIATAEVFEIMMGTALVGLQDENQPILADFTAMVGIAGSLCGVVVLQTSAAAARRIAAKMLGCDEADVSENVQDAFGEVCNMVAGSFKAKVAGLADGCALSVPTVISGKDYALHSLANGERFRVSFSFEDNPLSVTLDVHS